MVKRGDSMEIIKGIIVIIGFCYILVLPVIEFLSNRKPLKEIQELKEK